MGSIVKNLGRSAALLIGAPALLLFLYDVVAVQPRLPKVRAMLAAASPQDASPPPLIRRMIDASSSSVNGVGARIVVSEVYPHDTMTKWHMRTALWSLLLPIHLGRDGMYGLFCSKASNGVDEGLNNFALREFSKPLDRLSANEAAMTVAISSAPTIFQRDRDRLQERATWLLKQSGLAP